MFSSTAITLTSSSDTDVDSADVLELHTTLISTWSEVVDKYQKDLLARLNQQNELAASLQQQLQQKETI